MNSTLTICDECGKETRNLTDSKTWLQLEAYTLWCADKGKGSAGYRVYGYVKDSSNYKHFCCFDCFVKWQKQLIESTKPS